MKAAGATNFKLCVFQEALAQQLFDFYQAPRGDFEHLGGGALNDVFYNPARDVYTHEDDNHKMKCLVQAVRMQQADVPAERRLLSRTDILQACNTAGTSLKHVATSLSASADQQNVIISQELLYNIELQRALLARGGDIKYEAVTLRIFAEAHQAYDAPGLTVPQRATRCVRERCGGAERCASQ